MKSTIIAAALALVATPVLAAEIQVLVPLTGFLSTEGRSQHNGAMMAIEEAGKTANVVDVGTDPKTAVEALGKASFVVGSMLGSQAHALALKGAEIKVPIITVSGSAAVTQNAGDHIFRFFSSDTAAKRAQVEYAAKAGAKKVALVFQTTGYGIGGATVIREVLKEKGIELVYDQGIPIEGGINRALIQAMEDSKADMILLHLHAVPTSQLIGLSRQIKTPMVAGSGLHQPAIYGRLSAENLAGRCVETGAFPQAQAAEDPKVAAWNERYEKLYGTRPDGFALAQYDATTIALKALEAGGSLRDRLATETFVGIAGTYKNAGNGDMATQVLIACWDGSSTVPKIIR